MAKPRVFISSTYYDLKYIRRSVEQFVESLGYEATVFESGDVPFSHDIPLDESCYREIGLCHILAMIIGGRYGSSTSEERERAAIEKDGHANSENEKPLSQAEKDKRFVFYNSVTSKEYQTARELDIPIYIFVEKGVLAEYETYKKNRTSNLQWAHVDSVNIFRLLDDIFAQSRNNLVKEFGTADDITSWLRDQWAGLLAHFISKRRDDVSVGQLKAQMDSLSSVVSALKTYSEQIVRNVSKSDPETIISNVDKELHAKQAESMIKNLPGLNHLIEAHGGKPEALLKAFLKAESFDDLAQKLDEAMGGEACGAGMNMLLDSQNDVNRVRQNLTLKPFPPHSSDSSDNFRASRMRKMRELHERNLKKKIIESK